MVSTIDCALERDDDAQNIHRSRQQFRWPYLHAYHTPGSKIDRGGLGLSMEPSFAMINRVLAPYGAGGRNGCGRR